MEHYTAIKRKGSLTHTAALVSFQRTMLKEKANHQKVTCCVIPLMEHSRNHKITEWRREYWLVGVQVWVGWEERRCGHERAAEGPL